MFRKIRNKFYDTMNVFMWELFGNNYFVLQKAFKKEIEKEEEIVLQNIPNETIEKILNDRASIHYIHLKRFHELGNDIIKTYPGTVEFLIDHGYILKNKCAIGSKKDIIDHCMCTPLGNHAYSQLEKKFAK